MGETGEQWKPCTLTQHLVTHHPDFVLDSSISLMPGTPVQVHEAYLAGEGTMGAAVLGLVPMVNQRGTGEPAQGELDTFLCRSCLVSNRTSAQPGSFLGSS